MKIIWILPDTSWKLSLDERADGSPRLMWSGCRAEAVVLVADEEKRSHDVAA